MKQWSIRISDVDAANLFHRVGAGGVAILACGMSTMSRSSTLLVRKVFIAERGIDDAIGAAGHHQLAAHFVRDCAAYCAENELSYVSVHSHGSGTAVDFSKVDFQAHERLYPSLLQLLGRPVAGLVVTDAAAAAEIWTPDGKRESADFLKIVGKQSRTLRPKRIIVRDAPQTHHRQSLLLGEVGQAILNKAKVGIVGAGGVGSLIVEYLARLGVGNLVVADPDLITESNFSRIVGSYVSDYKPRWFWQRPARKVDIAFRAARLANPEIRVERIFDDFRAPEVVARFLDCDYLFLAADPASVRLLFNQVVHQYLIPGSAIGSRAVCDRDTGRINQLFSVVRLLGPGAGCLWCNGFITPKMLNEEATSAEQLKAQRYVDDDTIGVPSVITLNAIGASLAADTFMRNVTDIASPKNDFYHFDALEGVLLAQNPRSDKRCSECAQRYGLGDGSPLTTIERR
jgi:hypothetical protein